LGTDTDNLADTVEHTFGDGAVTFDKVDGVAGTVFGGIQSTIPTIDTSHLFEAGGFVGMSLYLPNIDNVISVRLRLGTDNANYQEWSWPIEDLTAALWLDLLKPAGVPNYAGCLGNGWLQTALTYVAVAVEFSDEADALAGIIVDHIGTVGGRVTSAQIRTLEEAKLNLTKVSSSRAGVSGNGVVQSGTQRVTIASDSTGKIDVDVSVPPQVYSGQNAIAVPGTAEVLGAAQALLHGVTVKG